MRVTADLRAGDRGRAGRVTTPDSPWAQRVLPAMEGAADHTELWWTAAGAMATVGGSRGRTAATTGTAGLVVAQVLSKAVAKRWYGLRRPPQEWVPTEDVRDRPVGFPFPSEHTAAASAAAVVPVWPAAGAVCAVSAVPVAAQRVRSEAHHLSDVAAGGALGLASAALVRVAPRLLS
ncbi:phosphatase PAP2 family protein [Streptomyces prunicolor]|uniref:phosphatase PAP2 family protein n=1 Tax=Streptomyces prunicolor TaxID=67348 RepID=UPI00371AEF7D